MLYFNTPEIHEKGFQYFSFSIPKKPQGWYPKSLKNKAMVEALGHFLEHLPQKSTLFPFHQNSHGTIIIRELGFFIFTLFENKCLFSNKLKPLQTKRFNIDFPTKPFAFQEQTLTKKKQLKRKSPSQLQQTIHSQLSLKN